MKRTPTRRTFLKTGAAVTLGSLAMSGTASASSHPVTAFDIDGSLTREPTRNEYWTRREDGETVGIVTARPGHKAQEFINQYELDPAFLHAGVIKTPALNELEREYGSASSYTYVGSWLRDWVAAYLAGWGYVDGGELTD